MSANLSRQREKCGRVVKDTAIITEDNRYLAVLKVSSRCPLFLVTVGCKEVKALKI